MTRWLRLVPALLATTAAASCVGQRADAPQAPCLVSLGADAASDLVLDGSGACPGTLRFALRVATGDPASPSWASAVASPIRVEGSWEIVEGNVATRRVVVRNASSEPVDLVALEWTADGLAPELDRMLHDGYQSWSYTGLQAIPESVPEHAGTAAHGGDGEDVLAEVPGVSWWVTALANAEGAGLVAGADGATVLDTYVAADRRRLRLVQGATGDVVRLAPGESRALDGVVVVRGDVRTGLDAYARRVAAIHPPPRRPALGGWGSWNLYYEEISADTLRPEMAWVADRLAPRGLTTFLTDDGYEPHWGAWTAKPGFGVDLAAYAGEQSARGLSPAIWVAPVYVDTADPVFAAHPDWFVGKPDGSGARVYLQFDNTQKAALDVTHPEARAFALDQLRALWSAGFRVFKLDFLFGAAISGRRREPITGLESYARWMRAIREALPEAHLIGCGAPLLPSVGWFDSMRTGPDVAFAPSPEPLYVFYAAQARQTAARAFTDAWWAVDPDVVLLRGARITDAEAFTVVVFSALAGGNYLLGDGRQAGELRAAMALDPEILAMTRDGRAARADDLTVETDARLIGSPVLGGDGQTAIPHVWRKTTAAGDHGWIAVFGWLAEDFAVDLELPAGTTELVPPTEPGPLTARAVPAGRRRVAVAPRAVRLFEY